MEQMVFMEIYLDDGRVIECESVPESIAYNFRADCLIGRTSNISYTCLEYDYLSYYIRFDSIMAIGIRK